MGLNGGNLVKVTEEKWYRKPAWSPDGGQIAYASNHGGSYSIWVVYSDGGNRVQLTDDSAADIHPAWQPAKGK